MVPAAALAVITTLTEDGGACSVLETEFNELRQPMVQKLARVGFKA